MSVLKIEGVLIATDDEHCHKLPSLGDSEGEDDEVDLDSLPLEAGFWGIIGQAVGLILERRESEELAQLQDDTKLKKVPMLTDELLREHPWPWRKATIEGRPVLVDANDMVVKYLKRSRRRPLWSTPSHSRRGRPPQLQV